MTAKPILFSCCHQDDPTTPSLCLSPLCPAPPTLPRSRTGPNTPYPGCSGVPPARGNSSPDSSPAKARMESSNRIFLGNYGTNKTKQKICTANQKRIPGAQGSPTLDDQGQGCPPIAGKSHSFHKCFPRTCSGSGCASGEGHGHQPSRAPALTREAPTIGVHAALFPGTLSPPHVILGPAAFLQEPPTYFMPSQEDLTHFLHCCPQLEFPF